LLERQKERTESGQTMWEELEFSRHS